VGTLLVEEEPEDEDDPVIYADVQKNAFWRGIRVVLTRLHDLRFLWGSRQLLILIPLLSVGQLYVQSADFFMQYVSKRYNWRISQASFLLSYRNVVNLILLSAIMPAVSSILLRRGYNARSKDLWISRASILALANGAFIIGLSPIISMLVIGKILNLSTFLARNGEDLSFLNRSYRVCPRSRVCARGRQPGDLIHRAGTHRAAVHGHGNQ
jgi:hypothetical protein